MKTIKQLSATIITALLLTITSCSEADENVPASSDKLATADRISENGNNPDEAVFRNGVRNQTSYLYTQSNDVSNNQIFIYQKSNSENLRFLGSVPTAGKGTGIRLASHGAVTIDNYHQYLYAVNASSNTISSFEIKSDGNLTYKHTIPSGGTFPVSIAIYREYLYVLNAGTATINGFVLGHDGTFAPIQNSTRELSAKSSGAAQISFSPNGRYLYVTEKKTNMISMFPVDYYGVIGERQSVPSVGKTPFGFGFSRDRYLIVSNSELDMANLSSIASYNEIENGHLTCSSGALMNRQTAAWGIAITDFGRFAFVTNSGNNSISAYYISDAGNLYLTDTETVGGDTPTDIVVSKDNYTVFVICAKDNTIHQYVRTERGGLTHVGVFNDIPLAATGLATW